MSISAVEAGEQKGGVTANEQKGGVTGTAFAASGTVSQLLARIFCVVMHLYQFVSMHQYLPHHYLFFSHA